MNICLVIGCVVGAYNRKLLIIVGEVLERVRYALNMGPDKDIIFCFVLKTSWVLN
jgi:hypothetical protein